MVCAVDFTMFLSYLPPDTEMNMMVSGLFVSTFEVSSKILVVPLKL